MADQIEQIVIDLDVSKATQEADKLTSKLVGIEDRAARIGEAASVGTSRVILTTAQNTQKSVDRALDQFRKSVAFRTGDQIKQLDVEFQNLSKRVAGDPQALKQANSLYKELLANVQAVRVAERQRAVDDLKYQNSTAVQQVQIRRQRAVSSFGPGADPRQLSALNSEFDKLEQKALATSESVGARIAEFITSPTYAIRKTIGETATEYGKFGLIAAGALLVVGEATKKVFELVSESAGQAKEISNLSDRLGVSATEASVLTAQAKLAGTNIDSLSGFVRKLSVTISDGGVASRDLVAQFEALGINTRTIGGNLKDPISLMREFSSVLSKIPDHSRQVDILAKAFGRAAVEQLPLIKNFAETEEAARKAGAALDTDLINRMEEVDDQIKALGISWDVLKLKLSEKIVAGIELVISGAKSTGGVASEILNGIISGIPGGSAAAAGLGLLSKEVDMQINVKPILPPPEAFVSSAQTAGNLLADAYRKRVDVTSLGIQIGQQIKEFERLDALIAHGVDSSLQRSNIAAADKAKSVLESLKKQLKDLEAAPAKLLSSQEIAQAGADKLAEANERLHISLHFGDQPLLAKYYGETSQAVAQFNKQILQQDGAAGHGTKNLLNLLKGLDDVKRAAKVDLINVFNKGLSDLGPEALQLTDRINDEQKRKQENLNKEIRSINEANALAEVTFNTTIAGQERDRQIRAIELTDAKTLQQKVDFEIKKGTIESDFIQKRLAVQLTANNLDLDAKVREQQELVAIGELTQRQADEHSAALRAGALQREKQERISAFADTIKAQEDALIKSAQLIAAANTSIFDRFKRESEGIFDAMLTKSQNIFQAIGNALKNAILTTIKDIVSTQVARSLTQLVTGDKVGLTPGAIGTGPLAKIAATLGIGARPTFGSVQSKLEQAGHLGDMQLISSPIGNAVPVVVANPGDIRSNNVDVKNSSTSSQVNQSFTIGGLAQGASGGFRSPLAATIALATGLGLSSAAQASPAGYKPLVEQVQSSISYGGEFAGLNGGGGGGGNPLNSLAVERGGFTGNSNLSDVVAGSRNPLIDLLGGGGNSPAPSGTTIPAGGGRLIDLIKSPLPQNLPPEISGVGQSTSGPSGIGSILKSLGSGIYNRGINLTPSYGTTGAGIAQSLGGGVFGKAVGGLAAGAAALGAPIGLGLLFGSSKNPYTPGAAVAAGGGGALAGFSIGSQIPAIGGVGGALLGAGAGLIFNGVQRGGVVGLGEDIAGGAIAGAKFGPVGAAIGAGVGAVIGTIRLFVKSKVEKMHDIIKSTYQVDIGSKSYLQQMVQIANQNYGGNVEVAARSPEVRNMVELWAQATGQNSKGIIDRAQASIFSNKVGGGLQQQSTYFDGQAVLPGQTSSTIGVPILTPHDGYINSPIVGGANTSAGNGHTTISLDPAATQALLSGQMASYVDGNPRAISQAASSGMDASAARRSIASSVLRPSFLTS